MMTVLGSTTQASLNLGSVLQEDDNDSEVFHHRFRQFHYKEGVRPTDVFNKLLELCSEWLKPKMHSKKQMVKLLTLEQYLTIMPQELETWVTEQCPESTERILSLLEEIQMKPETIETKVRKEFGIWGTRPKGYQRQVGLDLTFVSVSFFSPKFLHSPFHVSSTGENIWVSGFQPHLSQFSSVTNSV
ncbi:Zinc finger protein 449 [Myotis davidii]|uniref:Zinc finger protein 449 n=1 Tax=Myotis davidii TaxID=225400 RepID=L5M495_MYODS|nr:Zinc finger protein 449 [Myotis davidii]